MILLLLLQLAGARLCQDSAPTTSLFEELRMCRELNFAFCVEASSESLVEARVALADELPADIAAAAAASQVSAVAVVADRYLTRRYKALIEASEPSQTCLHYWRLAACSETFSVLGATAPKLCYATCRAVQTHCTAQFLTPGCAATLQYGDAAEPGVACTDYAALVSDDTCVIGDAPQSQSQQQPQSPSAGIVPASNSPTIGGPAGSTSASRPAPPVAAGAGAGGGGGGAANNGNNNNNYYYQPPFANTAPKRADRELCATLEMLVLALVVYLALD